MLQEAPGCAFLLFLAYWPGAAEHNVSAASKHPMKNTKKCPKCQSTKILTQEQGCIQGNLYGDELICSEEEPPTNFAIISNTAGTSQ